LEYVPWRIRGDGVLVLSSEFCDGSVGLALLQDDEVIPLEEVSVPTDQISVPIEEISISIETFGPGEDTAAPIPTCALVLFGDAVWLVLGQEIGGQEFQWPAVQTAPRLLLARAPAGDGWGCADLPAARLDWAAGGLFSITDGTSNTFSIADGTSNTNAPSSWITTP
jgi:hypothetical protein